MSVYFITARELGRVKIGSAVDPKRRVSELQTGSSCTLTLEAVIPGGRREERELHGRFSSLKIRGEWFSLNPQIEELIATGEIPPAPAPAPKVSSPKRKRYQDDEPWFSRRQLRQMEKYALAMTETAADRAARAKQRTLDLELTRQREKAA